MSRYPSESTVRRARARSHQPSRSLPLNEVPLLHFSFGVMVYFTVSGVSEVSSAEAMGPLSP